MRRSHRRVLVSLPLSADPDSHFTYRASDFLHPHVLPECQLQHNVAGWIGIGNRRFGGRRHCDGGERVSPSFRATSPDIGTRSVKDSHRRRQAGRTRAVLFSLNYCGLVPPGVFAGGTGGTHVPPPSMDEDSGRGLLVTLGYHAGSNPHGHFHSRKVAARVEQSNLKIHAGSLLANSSALPEIPQNDVAPESGLSAVDVSLDVQDGQSIYASLV